MTGGTAAVSVLRSSARPISAASSGGTSDTASREVALVPDSVSAGAGNQVSRIDPFDARVATPMPAAPVTIDTVLPPPSRRRIASRSLRQCDSVSARRAGGTPARQQILLGSAGLARGSDRADRSAGRHPQRVEGRSAYRRRGGDRPAQPDVRL